MDEARAVGMKNALDGFTSDFLKGKTESALVNLVAERIPLAIDNTRVEFCNQVTQAAW
jgi:hypothetical protein